METQLTCKENATKVKHDCSQNVCKKGTCDYFPTPPSERAKHMISGGILLLQRSGPSTACRVFNYFSHYLLVQFWRRFFFALRCAPLTNYLPDEARKVIKIPQNSKKTLVLVEIMNYQMFLAWRRFWKNDVSFFGRQRVLNTPLPLQGLEINKLYHPPPPPTPPPRRLGLLELLQWKS